MTAAACVRFGTKAQTLETLSPLLGSATVLASMRFSVGQWRAHRDELIDQLLARDWATGPLAVRSSALVEDSLLGSQAGRFHTELGVVGPAALVAAVDAVIDSYGQATDRDQVLVQPELRDTVASGVACSCDPSSGAPYRVVTWVDDATTSAVTSGQADGVRTWYGTADAQPPVPHLRPVLDVLAEVVELTGHERVEIEFGITAGGGVVLFQARPLVVRPGELDAAGHRQLLDAIGATWARTASADRRVLGGRPTFGVMPDWNPAEIIGVRPRPLALSLYRRLITDETWARSRAEYGYRDLTGVPLLTSFAGLPYVDVRASFTSFVPAALSDELAGRLVDVYLAELAAAPHLHDKVEFEIVLSCNTFDLDKRMSRLADHGFDAAERLAVRDSLVALTNRLVDGADTWRVDLRRLRRLPEVALSETSTAGIGPLLAACAEHGALPFAGLARAGFVGMQLLNGLVAAGVLGEEDKAGLLRGLNTVAGALTTDFGRMDRKRFLERYGHLRPGTYDILSPRYDEDPDRYFDWARSAAAEHPAPFRPSRRQLRDIGVLLEEADFSFGPEELLAFVAESIRGREQAKFEFTKVLSGVLVLAGRFGREHGLTDDDMSYVDVETLTGGRDIAGAVERGRAAYGQTRSVLLPPLLTSPADIRGFELPDTVANFVTQLRVLAPVADIERGADPEGAIAFVASADPGYDWLFSRGIRGLVTAYGGTNSHMAIRAQELGIPAVTGAGERKFEAWRRAAALEIDCANRLVREVG
jgi:phosphohistidine swiveling domain-containing protein